MSNNPSEIQNNKADFLKKENKTQFFARVLNTYVEYYQDVPLVIQNNFYPRSCVHCRTSTNNWVTVNYTNRDSGRIIKFEHLCVKCAENFGISMIWPNDLKRSLRLALYKKNRCTKMCNLKDECLLCDSKQPGYDIQIKVVDSNGMDKMITPHICEACFLSTTKGGK